MAALRSEPAAVAGGERVVARAFGGVVLMNSARPGSASYDSAGVRFVFVPAEGDRRRYAIDIEQRDTPIPSLISRALGLAGGDATGRAWTALEVRAKLAGIPVLALLRAPAAFAGTIRHHDTMAHWVTVGYNSPIGPSSEEQQVP